MCLCVLAGMGSSFIPHTPLRRPTSFCTPLSSTWPPLPPNSEAPASMQWSAIDMAKMPGASALEGSLEDEPHIGPLDGPDR